MKVLHLVGGSDKLSEGVSRRFYLGWEKTGKTSNTFQSYILYINSDDKIKWYERDISNDGKNITIGDISKYIKDIGISYFIPHMYCRKGLFIYNNYLRKIGLIGICENNKTMQLACDKLFSKDIFNTIEIPSPKLYQGDNTLLFPLVFKNRYGTNSLCVKYIKNMKQLDEFHMNTQKKSNDYFAEQYIDLGKEIRAGVIRYDNKLVVLPQIEYSVSNKIRSKEDKFNFDKDYNILPGSNTFGTFELTLQEKTKELLNKYLKTAFHAFGCNLYALFDVRIGTDGIPYFIEPCFYCSFGDYSPIVKMSEKAGISRDNLLMNFINILK